MNCEIKECITKYKSDKIAIIDSEIASLSNNIRNMNSGKIRQCHNDILNTYVVHSRIKQLKCKIKDLEDLRADYEKQTAEELFNNDAVINCLKLQLNSYGTIVSINDSKKSLLASV